MMKVDWESTSLQELDISATDLSTECLIDMLTRIPGLRYLAAGQVNGFNDSVRYNLQSAIPIRISHYYRYLIILLKKFFIFCRLLKPI